MNIITLAVCLVSVCYAQMTTKHPHVTREPNESEGLSFIYSGITHDLIVKQRVGKALSCYIADLTPDEEQHVHSDSGLKAVELRVLSQLSTATMETVDMIHENNVKICGHAPVNGTLHYYVL
ncbi:hypothetical protein ACF0H5_015375 [Mactra antiquata]